MTVRPITLRQAEGFVQEHHRHHKAPQGGPSGAGFKQTGRTKGGSWSRSKRPRIDTHPLGPKVRWEAV